MKYLLFVFYIICIFFKGDILSDYKYVIPEGFETINTLEENGVLGFVDEFGNGVDIYIEKNDYTGPKKAYLMSINNSSPIYPFNRIILIKNKGFSVKAFLFNSGDLQTHDEFEKKALTLLRSIAQGGPNETLRDLYVGFFDNSAVFR
jgi:hypothetical protein